MDSIDLRVRAGIRRFFLGLIVVAVLFTVSRNWNKWRGYSKKLDFEGVIVRKEISENWGSHFIVIKEGNKEKRFYISCDSLFRKSESGDYLIKKSGQLVYTLVKKTGDTIVVHQ